MGYYSGNGFAIRSPYIQHYGRKGMKWYQNIFEDFGSAIKSGYRGAKSDDSTRRMQSANAKAAKIVEADRLANGGRNTAGLNANSIAKNIYNNSSRGYANYSKIYGATNNLNYNNENATLRDKAIVKAGSFIGATAYNATVAARKIADAAKTAWSTVKSAGAKVINKGRELLHGLMTKSSTGRVVSNAMHKAFNGNNKVESKNDVVESKKAAVTPTPKAPEFRKRYGKKSFKVTKQQVALARGQGR